MRRAAFAIAVALSVALAGGAQAVEPGDTIGGSLGVAPGIIIVQSKGNVPVIVTVEVQCGTVEPASMYMEEGDIFQPSWDGDRGTVTAYFRLPDGTGNSAALSITLPGDYSNPKLACKVKEGGR